MCVSNVQYYGCKRRRHCKPALTPQNHKDHTMAVSAQLKHPITSTPKPEARIIQPSCSILAMGTSPSPKPIAGTFTPHQYTSLSSSFQPLQISSSNLPTVSN